VFQKQSASDVARRGQDQEEIESSLSEEAVVQKGKAYNIKDKGKRKTLYDCSQPDLLPPDQHGADRGNEHEKEQDIHTVIRDNHQRQYKENDQDGNPFSKTPTLKAARLKFLRVVKTGS
jgi:hypothetical protein